MIKFNNLDTIFSIQDVSDDKIIIKVTVNSPLTVAEYPFIQKTYQYITVTRGKKHLLVVVDEEGKTFSFHWGEGGYTLIGEDYEMLKQAVIQFLNENGIILDYDGHPVNSVEIFYNSNFNKWQLCLNSSSDTTNYWSNTATNSDDMKKECQKFVIVNNWDKVQSSEDHWKATDFKLILI